MTMRILALTAVGLIASFSAPVQAQSAPENEQCAFDLQVSDELLAQIAAWGPLGVDGTDGLCQRLAAEGAGLSIVGESGYNEYGTYAAVMIGFIDKASGLDSAEYRVNLSTSPVQSEDERDAAMRQALRTALASLVEQPDTVFTSLREELAEARRVFAPPTN